MKIKTSDLTGSALDWVVARCEDLHTGIDGFWSTAVLEREENPYRYSTTWARGGPIIQREHIGLISPSNRLTMFWTADIGFESEFTQFDHDPLIAAMRCYCCSKLGDTVDIPDELIGEFK